MQHPIVSREEWIAARKALLAKEKQLTRQRDQLAAERRRLPWVRIDKSYVFEGPNGVKVWIDPRSHRLLDGTTLDYDTSLMSRGFLFQNPHAKSTCGCGTSFSV